MQDIQKNWPGFIAMVHAADAGSFSGAARQLNLTPAAVGKSIGLLEQRLGVRLFNRTTRQLSLTSEGEQVLGLARAAMQAMAEASALARPDGQLRGLVRISCGTGYGRKFVLPVVARILDLHPHLRIDLNLSDLTVDLVREGFDIGIRGGSAPPLGMVARRIGKAGAALVASPQYLAHAGTPADWRELGQHRRIGVRFPSGRHFEWSFRVGSSVHTLEEKPTLLLSAPELAVDAALLHQGIAQVALHHAADALRAGKLVQVLKNQHVSAPIEMAIFYPHRRGLAPRVRVVADILTLELQKVDATLGETTARKRS